MAIMLLRAKAISTTEHTHIWPQCKNRPPYLTNIHRASKDLPHMGLTLCLVYNISRVEEKISNHGAGVAAVVGKERLKDTAG